MMMYVRVHNITLNVCGVAGFHLYLLYDILQYYYLYIFSRLCVLAMHLNHLKGNKMTNELT